MKKIKHKLSLSQETLRHLTGSSLRAVNGGFSMPVSACNTECTHCTCPTWMATCGFCQGGLTEAACSAAPPCATK